MNLPRHQAEANHLHQGSAVRDDRARPARLDDVDRLLVQCLLRVRLGAQGSAENIHAGGGELCLLRRLAVAARPARRVAERLRRRTRVGDGGAVVGGVVARRSVKVAICTTTSHGTTHQYNEQPLQRASRRRTSHQHTEILRRGDADQREQIHLPAPARNAGTSASSRPCQSRSLTRRRLATSMGGR